MTSTPLAASTSRAVKKAGSDSACVSRPTKSGPSMPQPARYSQIAWVIASTCASLKVPLSDEPRWPLVPKLTRCAGSPGSGTRARYSWRSLPISASRSVGAGWPASGWMGMGSPRFGWLRPRLEHHDAARLHGVAQVGDGALPGGRRDVLRRGKRGVEREMPAPAVDFRQRRIDGGVGHVEDRVQVGFVGLDAGHRHGEDARLAIVPRRLAQARAVPGDVRDAAAGERLAGVVAVGGQARVAAAQRDQLAGVAQHVGMPVAELAV